MIAWSQKGVRPLFKLDGETLAKSDKPKRGLTPFWLMAEILGRWYHDPHDG